MPYFASDWNGDQTEFWYDLWHPAELIVDLYGTNPIHDLGLGSNIKVGHFISHGTWRVPLGISNQLLDIFSLIVFLSALFRLLRTKLFGRLLSKEISTSNQLLIVITAVVNLFPGATCYALKEETVNTPSALGWLCKMALKTRLSSSIEISIATTCASYSMLSLRPVHISS